MTETGLKYWFLVDHGDARGISNIIPGRTETEVAERYWSIVGDAKLVRLTWSRFSDLTGCVIPSVCNESDYATGGMMIQRAHGLVMLWL